MSLLAQFDITSSPNSELEGKRFMSLGLNLVVVSFLVRFGLLFLKPLNHVPTVSKFHYNMPFDFLNLYAFGYYRCVKLILISVDCFNVFISCILTFDLWGWEVYIKYSRWISFHGFIRIVILITFDLIDSYMIKFSLDYSWLVSMFTLFINTLPCDWVPFERSSLALNV